MGLNNLEKIIQQYKKISIDTVGIIYFLEKNKTYYPLMKKIFVLAEKNNLEITLSVLVSLEIITGLLKADRQNIIYDYKRFLNSFPNLIIKDTSQQIAEQAAYLRAKYNLKTPDSIHLATAVENSELFITNDRSLLAIKEVQIFYLNSVI